MVNLHTLLEKIKWFFIEIALLQHKIVAFTHFK